MLSTRLLWSLIAALVMPAAAWSQGQIPAGQPLYIAAYLDVRPGAQREAVPLASQYTAAARSAPGNMGANAFQEIERPARLLVIEAWQDKESFDAYQKAPAHTGFRDRLKPILLAPYDQRVHTGFAVDAMPRAGGGSAVFAAIHVDVPGGRRLEAEALLKKLVDASARDNGRLRYEVYQQTDRPNHFTVFTGWANRAAFDASSITPHALQYRETLGPMLGALYDERLYRQLQ